MNTKITLAALSLFAMLTVAAIPGALAHNPRVTIPTGDAQGIVAAATGIPDASKDNADRGVARIQSNVDEIQDTPAGEVPVDQIHGIVLDGVVGLAQDEESTLANFATGPLAGGAHAIAQGKINDVAYDTDAAYEQTDEAIDHVDEVEGTVVAAPCLIAGMVIDGAACDAQTSGATAVAHGAYATAIGAQTAARGAPNSALTNGGAALDDVLALQSPLSHVSAFLTGGVADTAMEIQGIVGLFVGGTVVPTVGGIADGKIATAQALSEETQATVFDLINHETAAANGVLAQVCKAPLLPADPSQCQEGSLVKRVTDQGTTSRSAAESFVNSVQPVPILQAIVDAVFGITGAGPAPAIPSEVPGGG